MSLIALAATSYLDRQAAWQDQEAASKLSAASPDELRALLQMAIAEGQTQVERWVRDAMANRGIYASRRHPLRVESVMGAGEWLEKAMALVLAGGIMLSGPSLPVVDQSFSGGGYRQQPAVTQVYEAREDITSQYQQEIQVMKDLARGVSGANPSATTGPIYIVQELPQECPSFKGCAYSDGHIEVIDDGNIQATVIHEIAHTMTPHGHGDEFCELFHKGYKAITGQDRAWSSMCPDQGEKPW